MVTYDVHWVFVRQESIILYTQSPFIANNVTLSCGFKKRLSFYKYSGTWISFPSLGKEYYCYIKGIFI